MTEDSTEVRNRCHCGTTMRTTAGGAKYCENCDQVQPQQQYGMARRKTTKDIRYEMYWVRQEALYKDNTKQDEVGSTDPEEDEGGTTDG